MLMALLKTALRFFYSYLKRRKQNVKNNNIYSFFKELISGVLQSSILGPIHFDIFINDLFLSLSTADLHNLAGDNIISSFSKDLQELKNGRRIRICNEMVYK